MQGTRRGGEAEILLESRVVRGYVVASGNLVSRRWNRVSRG